MHPFFLSKYAHGTAKYLGSAARTRSRHHLKRHRNKFGFKYHAVVFRPGAKI